jgi:nucleotide-binding universal stress UspA family protein
MSEVEIKIENILVPVDGSELSVKAAKYAIKVALCEKARVICVHVIPAPEDISEFEGKPFYSLQAYYEVLGKSAKPWFDTIKEVAKLMGLGDDKIITDIIADVSSTADAIINYASTSNVNLIVMGTKGRTGLKRFLIGSVADAVVRHAHCPVLVVR